MDAAVEKKEYRPSRDGAYEATIRAHVCELPVSECSLCEQRLALVLRDERMKKRAEAEKDIQRIAEQVPAKAASTALPTDAKARKNAPMCRGLLDYFPAALAAVSEVSRAANEQHNPGEEMHWAREKSTDQADCIVRHLIERGTLDTDGLRHSAKVAWRALALLQTELEAEGAAPGRASKFAGSIGCTEGQTATT